MAKSEKDVDVPLDRFAEKGVEIPQSHFVIHENVWFIGQTAEKVRQGEWTINDAREFLESRGYRRETVNRFVRAVTLQLREGTGSSATGTADHTRKKAKGNAGDQEHRQDRDDLSDHR